MLIFFYETLPFPIPLKIKTPRAGCGNNAMSTLFLTPQDLG